MVDEPKKTKRVQYVIQHLGYDDRTWFSSSDTHPCNDGYSVKDHALAQMAFLKRTYPDRTYRLIKKTVSIKVLKDK